MKTFLQIGLSFLLLSISLNVYSGGYKCINYELEFQLKNGKIIHGIYQTGNYEKLLDFRENEFLKMLLSFNDSVIVFKKITYLKYPVIKDTIKRGCDFTFSVAYPEDIVKIKAEDIKRLKLISTSPCHKCNSESDYSWLGYHGVVLINLTRNEIDKLMTPPVSYHSFEITEYNIAYVVSYNKTITDKELKEICKNAKAKYSYKNSSEFKEQMERNDVIVFFVSVDI